MCFGPALDAMSIVKKQPIRHLPVGVFSVSGRILPRQGMRACQREPPLCDLLLAGPW